jgi:hypothetical protein
MEDELRQEIASIAFKEIWGEFNATSGRLTTDKTDKMCITMSNNISNSILTLIRKREIESRIDELKSYYGEFGLDRVIELQSQLKEFN